MLFLATAVPTQAAESPTFGSCLLSSCDIAELGATSVVLEPSIETNGSETEYSLEYAAAEDGPWLPVPQGSGSISRSEGKVTLHIELTGLSPETTYYVRILATNAQGGASWKFSFTTEGLAPRAEGIALIGTTTTSAQLQGRLKPHTETQWRLEYASAEVGPWITFASGTLAASDKLQLTPIADLSDLVPAKTYYVRESLANAQGEVQSPSTTFETAAPPVTYLPSIEGESTTGITEHSATLEAQINPGGLETTYEFWLEYAACQGPGIGCQFISVAPVAQGHIAGNGPQTVGVELTSLKPSYSYTYWVIAKNSDGTTQAPDLTFRTLPASTPPGTQEGVNSPFNEGGGQTLTSYEVPPETYGPLLPPATVDLSSPHVLVKKTSKAIKNAVKLSRALKACKERPRSQRIMCERQARSRYARTSKNTGKTR
ncbi:MAG: fibronectin type III domain-containing protein [Solirubrobacteraceae bacterium]